MRYGSWNRIESSGIYVLISLIVTGICLAGMAASAQTAAGDRPQLYAVVVGLTKFRDQGIPPLSLSSKDARDFSAALREYGQAFSRVNITLLLDEHATRDNISAALRNDLKKAGKDDVVIIYLSGHGSTDPKEPGEYYFVTHDARRENLYGTALMMNDSVLFKGISSERVLLLTDACHSGGYVLPGMEGAPSGAKSAQGSPLQPFGAWFAPEQVQARAKAATQSYAKFADLRHRIAISSSEPKELSYERPTFGNSVFTHFLLRGLRDERARRPEDGVITIGRLYKFILDNTIEATQDQQHPRMYSPKGAEDDTPVFFTPVYPNELTVEVNFVYLDDNGKDQPLTDGTVLKSGQRVGIGFNCKTDCYVYVFWRDSSGQVGRLFPFPELTDGEARVPGGQPIWLPYRQGEAPRSRWFYLDENPGEETIYFVASRNNNKKLEDLYATLARMSDSEREGQQGKRVVGEMERELRTMGFARRTKPKGADVGPPSPSPLPIASIENEIQISGAEAVQVVKFTHINR